MTSIWLLFGRGDVDLSSRALRWMFRCAQHDRVSASVILNAVKDLAAKPRRVDGALLDPSPSAQDDGE